MCNFRVLLAVALMMATGINVNAITLNVLSQYSIIQAAIDAASDDETEEL